MSTTQRQRGIWWGMGIATPLGLYGLIRLLPSLLTANTDGVVVREIALLTASGCWLTWLARRSSLGASALGLAKPRASDLVWGFATAVVVVVTSVGASMILRRLGIAVHSETALRSLAARPTWLLLLIILTAAISEEAVFRSAMIPAIERASGSTTVAVLISAAVFAGLHLGTYGGAKVIVVLLPGLAMAGLFVWRRSLTACLIAHLLIDAVGLAPLLSRAHT